MASPRPRGWNRHSCSSLSIDGSPIMGAGVSPLVAGSPIMGAGVSPALMVAMLHDLVPVPLHTELLLQLLLLLLCAARPGAGAAAYRCGDDGGGSAAKV